MIATIFPSVNTEVKLERHCPHCGGALEDDHSFCPACGYDIRPFRRCPDCGQEQFVLADSELHHCVHCGRNLN